MENAIINNTNQLMINDGLIHVTNSDLPHAIVTEVLLKNGNRTQVITLFNQNEINFEEIEIGVMNGLQHNRETCSFKSSFCSGVKLGLLRVITSTNWINIKHFLSPNS